jgi:hypothetical protein
MQNLVRLLAAGLLLVVAGTWSRAISAPPRQTPQSDESPEAPTIRRLKQQLAIVEKERKELRARIRELEGLIEFAGLETSKRKSAVPEELDRGMLLPSDRRAMPAGPSRRSVVPAARDE